MRAALLGITVAALCATAAHAAQYSFREVARDTLERTLSSTSGSINDDGDVAFLAFDESNAKTLYVVPRGGVPTPVVPIVTFEGTLRTRINASGAIAYPSQETSGRAIRVAAPGGSTSIALDTTGALASISTDGFDLNDAGQVAARVTFDDKQEGVVIGSGGAFTTVYSAPDADVSVSAFPALNDTGQAAFRVLDSVTGLDKIYRGSAAPADVVFDATVPPFDCEPVEPIGCFSFLVDVDDAGRVLVNGFFNAGGEVLDEGYFIQGETRTTVADTVPGRFEFLRNHAELNARGDVVFLGQEDDLGIFAFALYTGSDPATDRLIGPGDALLGSTVTSLTPYSFSINERGEILFSAQLQAGDTVLVVPEPSLLGGALASLAALAVLRRGSPRARLAPPPRRG